MPWNPKPEIAAMRDFAKEFNRRMVIAISVSSDGTLHLESYGETKPLCRCAAGIADSIIDAINAGIISPPVKDPGGISIGARQFVEIQPTD